MSFSSTTPTMGTSSHPELKGETVKRFLLLFTAVIIAGCVSEKTAMINPQGTVIHCDAWGFGWLGAPVAMAQHHDCVKKAQAAGYSADGTPAQPAQASAPH